ncbi:MAG: hypothetical protein QXF35_03160 [Candidatus Bilamarchaeaceae archaeon]
MGGTVTIKEVKEKVEETKKEEVQKTTTEEKNEDNTLAFIAYILTWLTGLIVFLIAKDRAKNPQYVKFHAMQAILLGIIGFIISPFTLFLGGFLVWLYCLYIGFTYAYKGEKYLVPYIGEYAEKYAND